MNSESQGSRQSKLFTTSLFCFHLKAKSLWHFRRDHVVSQHHLAERDNQIRIKKDFKFVNLRLPSRERKRHTEEGRKGSQEEGKSGGGGGCGGVRAGRYQRMERERRDKGEGGSGD